MAASNEDPSQALAPSIVEIISDKDSTSLGTGFIVTDDGLVVTCKHVVTESQNNLVNSVKVRFHSDKNIKAEKFKASLVTENQDFRDDASIDISYLKLDKLPEEGVIPVKLVDKVVQLKNHFASIGYKRAEEFTGLSAKGEIRILTHTRDANGNISSPELVQLRSPDNEIEPGMSGAPVLDIERDRVIGIITERYIDQYNPSISNMAFALPVKSMIELYPKLREKNPALKEISRSYEKLMEYIKFIIEKSDSSTDLFSSLRRSPQRRLHEYYVEQDILLISGDSSKWMTEDKDIISLLSKPNNNNCNGSARKIIEDQLLKRDDFFYLLIGAPFGGGTSTLAKWLAYFY